MLESKIIDIFCEISKETRLNLTMDKSVSFDSNSILFIKFVVELEKTFDIEFDDEMLINDEHFTINSICEYVNKKLLVKQNKGNIS